jgi:putative DNA primase/helicase
VIDFNDAAGQTEPAQQYDRAELLAALRLSADRWVKDLFPNGKIEGDELRVADISGRAPHKQGSCVIQLKGDHAGSYKDFTGGRGNDAVGTLADHFKLNGFDALKKAAEITTRYGGRVNGHANGHTKPWKKTADDHKREAEFERSRSVPAAGTLVETYFAARGIQLPETNDLRFSDNCTHWATKTGKPALLAVIRYPDGRPTGGIHRIYLRDDGSGHLEKKMLGPADCGVVMLAFPSPNGTLGIAEGIETAAAAMQLTRIPCWSTLSAGNMPKLGPAIVDIAGPLSLKRLVIFADRGDVGEGAATELRTTVAAAGIDVEVRLPRGGDDFADDLAAGFTTSTDGEKELPAGMKFQPLEPEIILPTHVADFEAEIQTLQRLDTKAATLIERIVEAGLHPLEVDRLMTAIRVQTGFKSEVIRDTVRNATKQIRKVGEVRKVNWWSKLECHESGEPKPILSNIATALREDREWRGVLAFNEFTGWITLRSAPPWVDKADKATFKERPWTDADGRQATIWTQKAGIHADSKVVFEAVTTIAEESLFHPPRDYLAGLRWDGTPRLDNWLITYVGVLGDPPKDEGKPNDEAKLKHWNSQYNYVQAIGARWMIGAVARIFEPGAKVDCALVLIGEQGILKSTVFAVLAGEWFTDQVPDLKSKDAMMQIAGVWIIEFSELSSFRGAETNTIKSFMSRRVDRYRSPYGRQPSDHPRQCAFGGTTNDPEFLYDPTGARRFWGVGCLGKIDIEALRRDRDQLWAEAVHRYRQDEKWWLHEDELIATAAQEADSHYVEDPWEQLIRTWLITEHKKSVFTGDVLVGALFKPKSDWTRADEMRVAACLRRLGWTKGEQIWSGENRGKRPFLPPKDWP